MSNKRILARAIVFAALLALGGWILALVQIWKMPWVIPTTLYGLAFYTAWDRFFDDEGSTKDGLEDLDDRPVRKSTPS